MKEMTLPHEKQLTLDAIVNDLQALPNVKAIVLGGSYATGRATEQSDLDVGIYYTDATPFSIDSVKEIAHKYAIDGSPVVTGFYEWGPWVNGGAWINTASGKVDFLYKNIDQIHGTIEKAQKGIWENHYEQQPPYGFASVYYLAETEICIALYDPEGIINHLKEHIRVYPPKLKQAIIQQSLWSTEFTIMHIVGYVEKNDVYNLAGSLARAMKNLTMTLFAINEIYPMSDKRVIDILEETSKIPANLREKTEQVLCIDRANLPNHLALLQSLFAEVVGLADGVYKPVYVLGK
ncbi:nucleotidyltransferase domain-containing protein [Emticicia sp. C21]|uniref:nucleotidyltransferase domain-containing protein n=1 Tax=Emticicia sp. C21 TaxID=2302915 RepID=UPI000E352FD3|nr:nucleotidyltransferase domain-containing protein [Emticicia sp. C21]RFS17043.1 nucleotidyltransferase domain-containing protein [Emticicia sp. C21]